MRRSAISLCLSLALPALLGGPAQAQLTPSAAPPPAKGWHAVTVAEGVVHPWGMAWLPDGRMLVTSRQGTLHMLKGNKFEAVPMAGLPDLFRQGQGGLFDIVVHPNDTAEPRIYMSLSSGTGKANRTVLVQGRFDGKRVHSIKTIFQVQPDKSGGQHFGGRLLWQPDASLLMSIGDGGNPPLRIGSMLAREQAQNLASHHGTIVRLTDAGQPAPGNPLAARPGALPEIWSYGHRNIQGMARDAAGRVWASEHGPKGGDELNLIEGGQNYGWPVQSYGADYRTGQPVGKPDVPGMVDPKIAWVPSPAPSGLTYYTGNALPKWRGSLISGGLAGMDVRRIVLDRSGKIISQERLDIGRRVRDVQQGPNGQLFLLTDEKNGRLMRIEAKTPDQGQH